VVETLYLMPTQRCNCSCDYCYLGEGERRKRGSEALFAAVLERFIAHLACRPEIERPQLRFIGGEPYLALRLVQRLTTRFLRRFPGAMVLLNTNGTLITDAALAPLAPFADRVHHVVSVDGPARLHDARRHLSAGGSAHARVVAGIRTLQANGFSAHVNMVLDPTSVETLEELILLLRQLGIDALAVSLLQTEPPLSPGTKYGLLRTVYEAAERHDVTLSGHHRLLLGGQIPGLRCRAGERSLLISADGEANICQRFVGAGCSAPVDFVSPGLDARSVKARSCCAPEAMDLGRRLHGLYRRRFPRYLAVTPLDRLLYGTIP
jgi:uncharacterized protein